VIWGTEGREFKSPQPDHQRAGQVVFLESTVWPVVPLGAWVGAWKIPLTAFPRRSPTPLSSLVRSCPMRRG